MRVHLKGIHSVKSGGRPYHYAWRGGPRLSGEPGSADFIASYNRAVASVKEPVPGHLFTLIAEYRRSTAFTELADATRRDYNRYLKMIEERFGDMPLPAIVDPRARGDFKEWRDGLAASPRSADLAWSVLARVLSVAKDRGRIQVNPCEHGGRLYAANRADAIWTEELIGRALAAFPERLRHALLLALWTGQRQGDLLRLTWSAVTDAVRLRQGKTGRHVTIPIGKTLRSILAGIPRVSPTVLTSSAEAPWTSDGFRSSWGRACKTAGIAGVTFHDIRGSTVTRLAEEGASVAEIASITGHSLADVSVILDRHYLSRSVTLAESAVRKLERKERRTPSVKSM